MNFRSSVTAYSLIHKLFRLQHIHVQFFLRRLSKWEYCSNMSFDTSPRYLFSGTNHILCTSTRDLLTCQGQCMSRNRQRIHLTIMYSNGRNFQNNGCVDFILVQTV